VYYHESQYNIFLCIFRLNFGPNIALITFYLHPHRDNIEILRYCIRVKVKRKAVPLQAWSGPAGSRKLRFPDYMTTTQDGGKVVNLTYRPPLPPGNATGTHFC
jgi:hypothetical protein